MMTIKQAFEDPEFREATPEVQLQVLSQIDPEFGQAPPDVQQQVISRMIGGGAPAAPQTSLQQQQQPALAFPQEKDEGTAEEPSFWRKTWDTVGRPMVEGGAAAAGGVIGALGGPIGAAGGGALGYMIGNEGADTLEEALGWRDVKPFREKVDELAGDATTALAQEVGGKVMGDAAGYVGKKAGKMAGKAGEVLRRNQLFKEQGVTPSVSDVHGGVFHPKVEGVLGNSPVGDPAARVLNEKQVGEFTDSVTDAWNSRYRPREKAMDDVGQDIIDRVGKKSQSSSKAGGNIYAAGRRALPDQAPPVTLDDTEGAIIKLMIEKNEALDSMQDMAMSPGLQKQLTELYAKGKGGQLDYRTADRTLKLLNAKISSLKKGAGNVVGADGANVGQLKFIRNALKKDLDKYASEVGGKFEKVYKAGDKYWANTHKPLYGKNSVGQQIGKRGVQNKPAAVLGDFLTKDRGYPNISKLKDFKRIVGDQSQEMNALRREFLDQKILKTKTRADLQEYVPGTQIRKALDEYGDDFLKELFSPGEISLLRKQAEIGDMMDTAFKKFGNPSGTARNVVPWIASAAGRPIQAASTLMVDALATGLYKSKVGRALLIKAVPTIKRAIANPTSKALDELGMINGQLQAIIRSGTIEGSKELQEHEQR